MYKPIKYNPSIKLSEFGNYSIDINPINSDILISNNTTCSVYPKELFLSQSPIENNQNNNNSNNKIESDDTIIYSKFSKDGEFIYTSDYEFYLKKYNSIDFSLNSSNLIGPLKNWKFCYSLDNKYISLGCYSILIYDIQNNNLIKELDNYGRYIYSLCFLENNLICVGKVNGSINIFNYNDGKFIRKIEEHCLIVRSLCYDNINKFLFSASDDLHINVIDVNSDFKVMSPIVGHKENISNMIYNENKNLLYTCSFDGTIKIWDLKMKNKCIQTLGEDNNEIIWDMSVSKNGDFICGICENEIKSYILA